MTNTSIIHCIRVQIVRVRRSERWFWWCIGWNWELRMLLQFMLGTWLLVARAFLGWREDELIGIGFVTALYNIAYSILKMIFIPIDKYIDIYIYIYKVDCFVILYFIHRRVRMLCSIIWVRVGFLSLLSLFGRRGFGLLLVNGNFFFITGLVLCGKGLVFSFGRGA